MKLLLLLLVVSGVPSSPAPPLSTAPPSFCDGWGQVWSDSFDAPSLDEHSWNVHLASGDSLVRLSTSTVDNVYVQGGRLVLRAGGGAPVREEVADDRGVRHDEERLGAQAYLPAQAQRWRTPGARARRCRRGRGELLAAAADRRCSTLKIPPMRW